MVLGASPERKNTIGRSANAAGFSSDLPEPAIVKRMTMVSATSAVVGYGDEPSRPNDPSASIMAPVQSRVVFSGAGMGLGGMGSGSNNQNSLELPSIGRQRSGF